VAWKFITVSYLFVLLSSCAPDGGESDGDIPEKPIFEEAPQAGIKDGHIIERYENGSPKEEFHLVNGKKNGSFKTWYEDGHLAKEGKMV
jgi:antitoxin component YwqK of YwqJK toxin-antitoxin module